MSILSWPSNRIQTLLEIKLPIIQAPMAGADSIELALAVSEAGGLGSLACTLLSPEQIRKSYEAFQKKTNHPLNLNFFCHQNPHFDMEQETLWRGALRPSYEKLSIHLNEIKTAPTRAPFDEKACDLLEELKPKVISFHFGLPQPQFIKRLKLRGITILASATSIEEALWLESHGCDAVIAQGYEAGGHRSTFFNLSSDTQVGTFALIPQIANALQIPVIATGGIANGRGIAAAFTLGADAVQLGTAYLFCPESSISPLYRNELKKAQGHQTVLTNVFTGRPARGIITPFIQSLGPMSDFAPDFPLASAAISPLRSKSEAIGSSEFMQMWAGQASSLCEELPAKELTLKLAHEAQAFLNRL